MKHLKQTYKKHIVVIFFLVGNAVSYAQPTPGGDYGPPDLPSDTGTPMGGSAPIDGGTLILLSLALLYLLYKNRKALQKALGSLI